MSNCCEIVIKNRSRYLKSPTPAEIQAALDNLGICGRHFERFFGLPINTISKFKIGADPFPVKYWHFVFENLPEKTGEKQTSKPISEPKPKSKRAKKKRVVLDEKIRALL